MKEQVKFLDEEPDTIEGLDKLRRFCNEELEKNLEEKKITIDTIIHKLDLAEVMNYKI